MQTPPAQMALPTRGADTNAQQIQINWVAPTDGGSPILSYELDLVLGNNTIAIVGSDATGNYLRLTYLITDSIIAGNSYTFIVRAKNRWGWG